jgi:hypothetical protein
MNNSININGSIGYTLLKNGKNNILVLADMHDELPYCDKKITSMFINEWFETKKNSVILLEEVPRYGVTLKELWPSSPHTQKLKDMYLKKDSTVIGVDPRPYLVEYSAVILNEDPKNSPDDKYPTGDDTLKEHFNELNKFYSLTHEFFIKLLPNIYNIKYLPLSPLGQHFLDLKHFIRQLVKKNSKFNNKKMKDIIKENSRIIDEIDKCISNVMEWYIIANIFQGLENGKNNFIIHAGLAHTTNLIELLQSYYGFQIVSENGITHMDGYNVKYSGCLEIPNKINDLFGGYGYTNWL